MLLPRLPAAPRSTCAALSPGQRIRSARHSRALARAEDTASLALTNPDI